MPPAKNPSGNISTWTGPWIWVVGVFVTALWPYWAFHGLGPVAVWIAEGVWLALVGTLTVLIVVATARANQRREAAARKRKEARQAGHAGVGRDGH
jgi:heme exporter protein D